MQQGPFLFGASTSAHQVEGGNTNNDWWEWEKTRPKEFRSGRAADSWNLYKEDFDLAEKLGHNAHRLSLEWSRIEPMEGRFNQAAIRHYRAMLEDLRARGIKTFVTLHHFTNPTWLARKGAWESNRTPELFNGYAKYCAQHLGDLVDFWITINEPMVYASQSYARGIWPPQKKSVRSMLKVMRTMARAHRIAYRTLHSVNPHVPVGLANSLIGYFPEDTNKFLDCLVAGAHDWFYNHLFLSLIANKQDFIGVNYYFSSVLRGMLFPPFRTSVPYVGPTSDLNWPIVPHGLTHVLLGLKKYKKPTYITENGIADADDTKRADFIRSHMRAIEQAQKQGCDVRGYIHWALIDNFEWAEGFAPRFGLIGVDFATMKRTIRPSAYVYKAIIEQSKM